MKKDRIMIRGARVHNLKNIDLEIPRNQLVVMTGISGSGKSSLAFDTIYAEGQRRYVESLSAYARQFLGQMEKPDVDYIEGLSPAISIDQKTTSRNPRSTVGTVTEIYDYLRLLFARIGQPHCPTCGCPITKQTVEQIVDQVMALPAETRFHVLAPIVRGRKGEYTKVFSDLKKEGFVRVRVDGEIYNLDEEITLSRYKQHWIEVVIDRLILRPGIEQRLADSVELALEMAKGLVIIAPLAGEETLYSANFACPQCGFSFEEITPRMFSFNSPYGACPDCDGLGFKLEIDPEKVLDKNRSLREGAVLPWSANQSSWSLQYLLSVARHYGLDPDRPLKEATSTQINAILYGSGREKIPVVYQGSNGRQWRQQVRFEGIINNLSRRYRQTESEAIRQDFENRFMTMRPCSSCHGARLRPESLAVKINAYNISQVTAFSIAKAKKFFAALKLTEKEQLIARQILKEIDKRLGFLVDVGLDYLTLDRTAGSLSGGEAQRIRLATQIGSSLVGVLYILDEPSIGLHQRDNRRLINALLNLRDLGNTLIVVEHDEEMMRAADYLIDIGPGPGPTGAKWWPPGIYRRSPVVPAR